jgi:hypothetical protein
MQALKKPPGDPLTEPTQGFIAGFNRKIVIAIPPIAPIQMPNKWLDSPFVTNDAQSSRRIRDDRTLLVLEGRNQWLHGSNVANLP